MDTPIDVEALFSERTVYPDLDMRDRLAQLVGLDEEKKRLTKILGLLVNPGALEAWSKKFQPNARSLLSAVLRRPPLIVFEGDVGSGKTELASTIGDAVARQEGIEITLFPLSLSARGQGRVGEMTQLISTAFEHVASEARKLKSRGGKSRGAVILLIDEADALAQSRESSQMHHEDRAGVNAFIRGVDRLAGEALPAAVIMCTNRLSALDPAVRRRAADTVRFARPSDVQRKTVLMQLLDGSDLSSAHIDALVAATSSRGKTPGFTFSDLTQRLIPSIVLDAYPSGPIDGARAVAIAKRLEATPEFREESAP